MDDKSIARSVGTDGLTVLLAAGPGQRHGMRVSSEWFTGTAYTGDVCLSWATGVQSGPTAVTVARIPAAVRVRKPADANVPGAPPRGAPV
jgi:hypothetical protein